MPPIQLQIDRKNDKNAKDEMVVLQKVKEMLENKKPVRDGDWNAKEIDLLNLHLFITAKPVVYLVNIGRDEYVAKKNKYLPSIIKWI